MGRKSTTVSAMRGKAEKAERAERLKVLIAKQPGFQAADFLCGLAKIGPEKLREKHGDDKLIAAMKVLTDDTDAA